jgi:hypothetical protein
MTATEGDVTLPLAENWTLPNVPTNDDYTEAYTAGWQQEEDA